ncbi:hypothetical protein [Marinobacterium sedimentorum]|nr:hypothetical protein [Marinobacterium sedimentorum]
MIKLKGIVATLVTLSALGSGAVIAEEAEKAIPAVANKHDD